MITLRNKCILVEYLSRKKTKFTKISSKLTPKNVQILLKILFQKSIYIFNAPMCYEDMERVTAMCDQYSLRENFFCHYAYWIVVLRDKAKRKFGVQI